jgi:hypothetical protein
VVDDVEYIVPVVRNVLPIAPQVAAGSDHRLERLRALIFPQVRWPGARVSDVSATCLESGTEGWVALREDGVVPMATVEFLREVVCTDILQLSTSGTLAKATVGLTR